MPQSLRRVLASAGAWIAVVLLPGTGPSSAQSQFPQIPVLLDRYYGGDFDGAVATATAAGTLDPVIEGLERLGDGWIASGSLLDRDRRELAAATFALESARTGVWTDWKTVRAQPTLSARGIDGGYQPGGTLTWAASARLIEWGCARFRQRPATPERSAAEWWWQLAAIAVAERAEDAAFLLGHSDRLLANPAADVRHLEHALSRYPTEPRLLLAAGIALDWKTWPRYPRDYREPMARLSPAIEVFEQLLSNTDVGAEAAVRLANLLIRAGEMTRALELLVKAEDATRDPYVVYLARLFRGQAHEALQQTPEAIAAYRDAAHTLPGAQAAAASLATLLAASDRAEEASTLAHASLTNTVSDPWRGYADADDRFWPELLARLRREIRP